MAFSKAGEETTPHGDPSRRLNGEGRGGGDDDLARKTRGKEGRESWGVSECRVGEYGEGLEYKERCNENVILVLFIWPFLCRD